MDSTNEQNLVRNFSEQIQPIGDSWFIYLVCEIDEHTRV